MQSLKYLTFDEKKLYNEYKANGKLDEANELISVAQARNVKEILSKAVDAGKISQDDIDEYYTSMELVASEDEIVTATAGKKLLEIMGKAQ